MCRYQDGKLATFEFETIEEAKCLFDKWKDEFRKVNETDKIINILGKDEAYESYCRELDDTFEEFRNNFDVNEGKENRNIRMAKERRARNESPWNKYIEKS